MNNKNININKILFSSGELIQEASSIEKLRIRKRKVFNFV